MEIFRLFMERVDFGIFNTLSPNINFDITLKDFHIFRMVKVGRNCLVII